MFKIKKLLGLVNVGLFTNYYNETISSIFIVNTNTYSY